MMTEATGQLILAELQSMASATASHSDLTTVIAWLSGVCVLLGVVVFCLGAGLMRGHSSHD